MPRVQVQAAPTGRTAFQVLMVLPPDLEAPPSHRRHRFPHQGPALVAASIADDGFVTRAADLELDLGERPLSRDAQLLRDEELLSQSLAGGAQGALADVYSELVTRLGPVGDVDAFAISIDRHTQILLSLLLGVELKRRYGLPVIVGGGNAEAALRMFANAGGRGVDIVTTAASPWEIRRVFRQLRELPRGRLAPAVDPNRPLDTPPDEWPIPDFSIYELDRYRRDPFLADGPQHFPSYDGSLGPSLFLPYHFSFDCQYQCAFCQRGGRQTAKSMERVVRDLATLAERHDCRDFLLFDTQINLLADSFSRALIDARLDVHWADSLRVSPLRPPNVLETMARAGCVGLTFGVESASDRMLKKMVKGHRKAQATQVIRDAHALEIMVRVNLLPCFPGETQADFEETREWVRENAFAIDDLAPSSFYLAEGSPVGQDPERYGIRIRGPRQFEGDHKFRKNLGSLAYDEVGGMRWEEREATLRPAEVELRLAWRNGRSAIGASCPEPSQAFALRRAYRTKREAYQAVLSWTREKDIQPTRPTTPAAPSFPPGSARAQALEAVRALAAPLGVQVSPVDDGPARFSLDLRCGGACRIAVERIKEGVKFYKRGAATVFWYSAEKPEPAWLQALLDPIAETLVGPTLEALAAELSVQDPAHAPRSASRFHPVSVIDMVRLCLKPAASVLVRSEADPLRGVDDLPHVVLSRLAFRLDERQNLVVDRFPRFGQGYRMLYVGRDRAAVERLRDLEERLYTEVGLSEAEHVSLQDELGRLLGFPACCTRAFAEAQRRPGPTGDFYCSLSRLGWDFLPVDWRTNHVLAHLYQLPFLIHVPCRDGCPATVASVEEALQRVYSERDRSLVRDVLQHGAVVWPDDRIALFRPAGAPLHGELEVSSFNLDPHPEVMRHARAPERTFPRDAAGFPDASVRRLRMRAGGLEVLAEGRWRWYPAAPASAAPRPLVLIPRAEPAERARAGVA